MEIVVRVAGIGNAGTNVTCSLEIMTSTQLAVGGEATIDPSWSEAEIESAIAETARDAIRSGGATVAVDEPVTIVGGVSKV